MIDIEQLSLEYRREGYSELFAEARVCQDIVLKAISESVLSRNVTIKGGVVMRSITGNVRRATRDIDFDFIKYKRGMKLGSMANCVLGKTRTAWRLWICGGVL